MKKVAALSLVLSTERVCVWRVMLEVDGELVRNGLCGGPPPPELCGPPRTKKLGCDGARPGAANMCGGGIPWW